MSYNTTAAARLADRIGGVKLTYADLALVITVPKDDRRKD